MSKFKTEIVHDLYIRSFVWTEGGVSQKGRFTLISLCIKYTNKTYSCNPSDAARGRSVGEVRIIDSGGKELGFLTQVYQ